MTAKKFVFDVSSVFISQIVALAISFVFNIVVGRFLGPTNLGLYSITTSIYTIVALLGGLGIPIATVKYVAEFKNQENKLDNYLSTALVNSAFFGLITTLVLFALSGFIADIFHAEELKVLIQIISFTIPIFIINSTLLSLLNGLREMKSYSFRSVLRSSLLLLFTFLLLLMGLSIEGVILAVLLSEIGILCYLTFTTRGYFKFNLDHFTKTTKMVVRFGVQVVFGSFLWTINNYVDKLLVGFLLSTADLGIYSIALVMANGLLMVPGAVSTVTYPIISEYKINKDQIEIQNMINRSMRYSVVIVSFLGLLLAFFSTPIILLLLKSQYLPAVVPLEILIFGMIVLSGVNSVGYSFTALGRPDLVYKLNIIILIVVSCLCFLLIPFFGINGAAIANAASFSLFALINFHLYKNVLEIKIDVKRYFASILFVGLILVLFSVANKFVNFYFLLMVCLVIYVVVVLKIMLTSDDKHYIKNIMKSKRESIFNK